MKSVKLAVLAVMLFALSMVAHAEEVAITAGPLAAIISLLPESIAGYIGKALAWISGIITIATAIVALTPSTTDDGILAKIRNIISVLSGNVLNNK